MLALFVLLVIAGLILWLLLYLFWRSVLWVLEPLFDYINERQNVKFDVQKETLLKVTIVIKELGKSIDIPKLLFNRAQTRPQKIKGSDLWIYKDSIMNFKGAREKLMEILKEEREFQNVEKEIDTSDFPVGKPESEETFTTEKGVFFSLDLIKLDMKSREREEAIKEIVALYTSFGRIRDGKAFYINIVNNVENKLSATAPGDHVAFPYGEVSNIEENAIVAIGISKEGINFNSLDNKPVNLVFMSAVKCSDDLNFQGFRIKYMAKVSRFLRDESTRSYLINAASREEIFKFLKENFDKRSKI